MPSKKELERLKKKADEAEARLKGIRQRKKFEKMVADIQAEQRKKEGELNPKRKKGQFPGERLGKAKKKPPGRKLGKVKPEENVQEIERRRKRFASTSRKPRARSA